MTLRKVVKRTGSHNLINEGRIAKLQRKIGLLVLISTSRLSERVLLHRLALC